jgi:hypothetical protein
MLEKILRMTVHHPHAMAARAQGTFPAAPPTARPMSLQLQSLQNPHQQHMMLHMQWSQTQIAL